MSDDLTPSSGELAGGSPAMPLDLDAIAAELADVEIALARLDAGTYFTDEVTGEELPDSFLADHPTARRRPAS